MHPAKSVIFFTTASGAGYGLLFLMIGTAIAGFLPDHFWLSFTGFALAFLLIAGGLVSSTFHLGHPERAWRALTKWRSSWLSREGVMALLTFLPTGLFALYHLYFPDYASIGLVLGLAGLVAIALTVYCTAMIYASLRPVHAWCNPYVPAGYLLLGLMSGAVLMNALLAVYGEVRGGYLLFSLLLLLAGSILKIAYWRFLDGTQSASTPESATGLGEFGEVRLLEAPHTEANYLMQEMGYKIARKHAARLRRIALFSGFILPFVVTALAFVVSGGWAMLLLLLAAALGAAGTIIERWLFFAEARHTVSLYYGARRV